MKVYIVEGYKECLNDWFIVKVFDSLEKAEDFKEKIGGRTFIRFFEVE